MVSAAIAIVAVATSIRSSQKIGAGPMVMHPACGRRRSDRDVDTMPVGAGVRDEWICAWPREDAE